jgi:hypothetical protein
MPAITVEPQETLARIFKRKTKELAKAAELEPVDFLRRLEPVDSGLSLYRVDRMPLLEAVRIVARAEHLHYGVSFSRASVLLDHGYAFTNRVDNHPFHTCARCPTCERQESPIYCTPSDGVCPFTMDLTANEAVRKLFRVVIPAMRQPELLARLAIQEEVNNVFGLFISDPIESMVLASTQDE